MMQYFYSKKDLVEEIRNAAIDAMAKATKEIATSTCIASGLVRLNTYINDEAIPNNIHYTTSTDYIYVNFSISSQQYRVVYTSEEDGMEFTGMDKSPSQAISKMLEIIKKYYFDIED